jgi:hypothetical protein
MKYKYGTRARNYSALALNRQSDCELMQIIGVNYYAMIEWIL